MPPFRPFAVKSLLVVAALATLSAPLRAETAAPAGDAGAYLSAHLAAAENDYAAAATWFDRALLADPTNPDLLDGAIAAKLALGDIDGAAAAARLLGDATTPDKPHVMGSLALLAADAKSGNFADILKTQGRNHAANALFDDLILGWAAVGTGAIPDAVAHFDTLSKVDGLQIFGLYHKALALGMTGDFAGADAVLASKPAEGVFQLRRGIMTRIEVLSQLERNPEALALFDASFAGQDDATLTDLRRRLAAGEPLPFDMVASAKDGFAEAFFTIALTLDGQVDDSVALLYARIAADLRPDLIDAQMVSARLLDQMGQYDLAAATYAKVPATDAAYAEAAIGQAQAELSAKRPDQAIALLTALSKTRPRDLQVLAALGNALRQQENYAAALPVYEAAIALLPKAEPGNWGLYYARAICKHQTDDWPGAEADFKMALTLKPDEPQVLNYLGYSYVDRGENLDEALKMIQKAVLARPDSGYIIDSLAWAYYRLGRVKDAVSPMEKASLLMPVDAIVTDHLGDVYWVNGRQTEARFQWRRALSFEPTETDATRIRRKLEVGLDQVLTEEKAAGTDGN